MSYDIYLEIDTGSSQPVTVAEIGNYTSNVSGMFALALTHAGLPYRVAPSSFEGSIANLHGMPATEATPYLERALAHMIDPANRSTYEAMNPKNGWGDFDGARAYLCRVLDYCRTHPKTTVHVSW